MKNIKAKDVLIPTVTLTVICVIIAGLLAVINGVTKDTIAKLEAEALAQSQRIVLSDADSFEEIADNTYCGKDASGATVGYVMVTSRQGYGGDVQTVVGIDNNGVITGINVTAPDETPGMGAKATNDDFKKQFAGLNAEGVVAVTKDGGDIDAISGATITSRAVCGAVSDAIEMYNSVKGAN